MRTLLVVAGLVVLLASCAAAPRDVPDDREDAWLEQRERLEALDVWRAEGRLALQSRNQGGNASFFWREQAGDDFVLRLSGAWGQEAARLSGGNGIARLDAGGGQIYHGTDAESLLASIYGWEVPVDYLRRWLIGLPVGADGEGRYTLDAFGRLATLEWEGWHIRYRRYRQEDGLDLPAELFARHETRAVEVRVAVDRWWTGTERERPDSEEEDRIPLIGS